MNRHFFLVGMIFLSTLSLHARDFKFIPPAQTEVLWALMQIDPRGDNTTKTKIGMMKKVLAQNSGAAYLTILKELELEEMVIKELTVNTK